MVFSLVSYGMATGLVWYAADSDDTYESLANNKIKYYVTFLTALDIKYAYAFYILQAASTLYILSHWILIYQILRVGILVPIFLNYGCKGLR